MTTFAESDGMFGPDSVLRKTRQEAIGLLGWGRALLLQLAHPMITAGVVDHSGFQDEPLRRLQRTLDLMYSLIFGDRRQTEAALRQFHRVHARVQGRLSDGIGSFPAGAAYHAHDPALKWWVMAVLIDTQLAVYDRFVSPALPDLV